MHKKFTFTVIILIIVFVFTANINIFNICSKNISDYTDLVFKSSKEKYICLVKYQYTTGAGYYCVKSNNKNFENMYMIIQSKFDPRFLKDNNDFSLDYNAEYLVEAKKAEKIMYEGESAIKLYADKITVLYNTNKTVYKIKDMTFGGVLKAILPWT